MKTNQYMKVVIIEDEQPAARRLKRMLEVLQLNVVTLLHSVSESVAWFKNNPHPELVFLDIQLSDGLSFEIFEKVNIKSAIIFTTAYDEYALKAFKFNSIDYLLKPIDADELSHAVSQYKTKSKSDLSAVQTDLEQLKNLLLKPSEPEFKTRFTIKIGPHLKVIPIDEIVCFYSENKGTYIHTNQNRSYLIDDTLEQIQDHINPSQFFRVNRTYTVNLEAIKDIVAYTNSRLKISLKHLENKPIIVSREKVKAFKQWLE